MLAAFDTLDSDGRPIALRAAKCSSARSPANRHDRPFEKSAPAERELAAADAGPPRQRHRLDLKNAAIVSSQQLR